MKERPIIIVSGLGRCGSSLTMQMLHASGIKCAGDFPAFEPPESNILNLTADYMRAFEAIKILDPQRGTIPKVPAVVIWLDRDPRWQSVSQLKFAMQMFGVPFQHDTAGKICASLKQDTPKAVAKFSGLPILRVNFELAIDLPSAFCERIAVFLKPWYACDREKMAACVLPREMGSLCQRDLSIEMGLCERVIP